MTEAKSLEADVQKFREEQGAITVPFAEFYERVGPQNGIERRDILTNGRSEFKAKSDLTYITGRDEDRKVFVIPWASLNAFFNPPPAPPVTPTTPVSGRLPNIEDPFPAEDGAVDPMIPTQK